MKVVERIFEHRIRQQIDIVVADVVDELASDTAGEQPFP